jgi:hypothetical protein
VPATDDSGFSKFSAVIRSTEVRDRVTELEELDSRHEAVRARNGEVLFTSQDAEACTRYIDENDYDPDRVLVERRGLARREKAELDRLRDLEHRAGFQLGLPWVMYGAGYFSADWARARARDIPPLSGADFSAWPLSEIDWASAASARRDAAGYKVVMFDGGTFYGI